MVLFHYLDIERVAEYRLSGFSRGFGGGYAEAHVCRAEYGHGLGQLVYLFELGVGVARCRDDDGSFVLFRERDDGG